MFPIEKSVSDVLSMPPPLIPLSTRINDSPNNQINPLNTTHILSNTTQQNLVWLKNMVNTSKDGSEILLQNALKALSNTYFSHINILQNELNQHQQSTALSIRQIEEKQKLLALQKKKLISESSEYKNKMNEKLNNLQMHRDYLENISYKYDNSINNDFSGLQISNNESSNCLVCRQCGYLSNNNLDFDQHLIMHRNDIPKLSRSEWKDTLLDLMDLYEPQLNSINLTNISTMRSNHNIKANRILRKRKSADINPSVPKTKTKKQRQCLLRFCVD